MKHFILSLFTLSLIVSCSKDNNNGEQPNQETMLLPKQVVERYTITERDQNGVETKIEHVDELSYEIVNNKIASATTSRFENKQNVGGSKLTIIYENDLPKTFISTNIKNNEEESKSTYKYENRKLVEEVNEWTTSRGKSGNIITYKYSGDKLTEIQEKGSDTTIKTPIIVQFVYVSDTEIKKTITSPYILNGEEKTRTRTIIYTLDSEKRVVKSVEEDETSKDTKEFKYDDKKNYKHHSVHFTLNPDHFLDEKVMKNNLTSVKRIYENKQDSKYNSEETSTYTYQYNDKGYPTRIEEVYKSSRETNSHTKTTEITY
ncbi:hypothetical protein [Capnocytophaga cynodegmi]|uniref:Uncharacterized protein n=1 Tax=Capnocytophaga cynodegmi TaxID=28189 RepID=A0A0B7H9T6_9FLAO|nr:hypothetical protein [Capnocytophaga cynodegmi]CEN34368.1 conserved exported hypothetical protein [Capnocytophaga cynodegmi]